MRARAVVPLLAAMLAWGAAACVNRVPRLEGARPSAEALAQAVLDALERRDRAALERLAVNEQEFRDHVWPELPVAQPERNAPFSYVWSDLRQKSQASLAATVARVGGERLSLVRLEFLDGTTPYDTYVVHRRSSLVVKDATGSERRISAFGSMLEKDGQFKVFSYVIDD